MTMHCHRNMGPYSSGSQALYDIKENLKSLGGSKDWDVLASGDGVSTLSRFTDIITGYGSGAGGLDNGYAWFLLQDADAARQLLFARQNYGYYYKLEYSRGRKFAVHGTGDSFDASGSPNIVLTDSGAAFTSDVVGKTIQITGATTPANDGAFTITAYTPTTVTFTNGSGVTEAYSGSYSICNGTATTAPTCDDQQHCAETRTATPYNIFPSSGSWYTHMAAEGDSPDGNVYPFWFINRVTGTGATGGGVMLDCVVNALSPSADGDKAIIVATQYDLLYSTGAYLSFSSSTARAGAWMDYGGGSAEWGGIGYAAYFIDGVVKVPGAMGVNPADGKFPVLPCFCARLGGSTNGIKGQSNLVRYKPTAFAFGDVIYDSAEYFLCVGDVLLRGWPDTTGPSI